MIADWFCIRLILLGQKSPGTYILQSRLRLQLDGLFALASQLFAHSHIWLLIPGDSNWRKVWAKKVPDLSLWSDLRVLPRAVAVCHEKSHFLAWSTWWGEYMLTPNYPISGHGFLGWCQNTSAPAIWPWPDSEARDLILNKWRLRIFTSDTGADSYLSHK